MNNIVAGIGDVLLRYPALIDDLSPVERQTIDNLKGPYVAVHLGASQPHKIPPNPKWLIAKLHAAKVPFVLVGHDGEGAKPSLRMHIEIVRRAAKFLGTLSCFNVVAQLAKVPSFVIVNRALKEPFVYSLMEANDARVEAWNNIDASTDVCDIYERAVAWCDDLSRL